MQRKTLTERLTLKYKLIVRNEENFADRWSLSFNFAGLLVVLTFLLIVFYILVTSINKLGDYLLGSDDAQETQLLITLASRLDSLEYELNTRDEYINNFKIMLEGGKRGSKDTSLQKTEKVFEDRVSPEEEEFRKKYEKEIADPSYQSQDGFTILYFSPPISGKVKDNIENDKITSLTIKANEKKTIKSLDAGVVVAQILNPNNTYKVLIQHKNGLLTSYDGIVSPVTQTNSIVKKGEDIAKAATQEINFRMLYNGKTLNPRQYIAW